MTGQAAGVLVAIDQSAGAHEAVRWAAADAAARGTGLTVATVVDLPRLAVVPISAETAAAEERSAARSVDSAVALARGAVPGLAVDGVVRTGNPAAELIRLAHGAQEVVVGSHGSSELAGLLIGSVSARVAEHAPCPVAVVRGRVDVAGPVVVGVDGSEPARLALEYGFGYADRHGLPLVALHVHTVGAFAYPVLPYPVPPYPITQELDRLRTEAVRETEHSLGRWTAKYPDVVARADVLEGPGAHLLTQASRTASLLVVGTRGHGGLTGMLLGSISHAAVRHAHCPVVVAR